MDDFSNLNGLIDNLLLYAMLHKHESFSTEQEIRISPLFVNENDRNKFIESIKNIEDEETKLLNLQKQYRSGEIKEKDLSEEQIKSLSALYDTQIANLKKSNQIRKQRLLKYRNGPQTDN